MAKSKIAFSSDISIQCYGIISTLPGYALMATINKTFQTDFKNIPDWRADQAAERTVNHFLRYRYIDANEAAIAICVGNKEFNQLLFKKIKDADFILCLDTSVAWDLSLLKAKEGIVFIYPIELKLLPGIESIWEYSFMEKE